MPPESLSFPSVRRSECPLSALDKHVPLRKVISQQLLGYRLEALGLATQKLQECAEQVRGTRTVVKGKGYWRECEGRGCIEDKMKLWVNKKKIIEVVACDFYVFIVA